MKRTKQVFIIKKKKIRGGGGGGEELKALYNFISTLVNQYLHCHVEYTHGMTHCVESIHNFTHVHSDINTLSGYVL